MMEEKTVHTEEKKTTKERKKETNKNGQNFAPLVQKKRGKKRADKWQNFSSLSAL